MKNNLDELIELIAEVRLFLELKQKTIIDADQFTSHTQGHINNITRRILALEHDYKEIKDRYSDKPEVFINFRKRAIEIQKEIDSLS
ncbi:MAG: hypothetical protein KFKLKKLM_02451 [Flavobacteriales bacterium]|nr:hypothetical protein [Flavobacteriales bacterium]